MKTLYILFAAILCITLLSATAWGRAGPSIEERLIRVEEGIKNLEKRIDGVETSLNKRIDELRTDMRAQNQELRSLLLTGFGVLFAGMFALVGFVIWDRRTAIAPVARTTKELEEREEKIIAVLREYAKDNTQLLEIMKRIGIL